MQYLGSPETEFPTIHVTGTNGKTSTVRMITQLLLALGLRVGAYTSPHLERVNERLTIDGEPVDDDTLDELLYAVALVETAVGVDPSHFEIMTAAAFRWFADEAVDVAVVEVGLGGTWDATNVVDAEVAVVTNVAVDHVEYLGPTRTDCQRQSRNREARLDPRPRRNRFRDRGDLRGARRGPDPPPRHRLRRRANNVLSVGGRSVDLYTPEAAYPDVFLSLHGAHQGDNAAIALATAETFVGAPLPSEVVAEAFATVQSPGRLEVVGRHPLVLLDGAHNVAGAQALRRALEDEFGAARARL